MVKTGLACPFCESEDVELISAWGAQIITSQLHCRRCKAYFEGLREDFDPPDHELHETDESHG